MEFGEYLRRIDEAAKADGFDSDSTYTELTGEEAWRDGYEEGLTPQEAWEGEAHAIQASQ